MPRIMPMLLLTAFATTAHAQAPSAQDPIACYNVVTGRVFSAIECGLLACRGTDGSGRQYSGARLQYGDSLGPCIRPRVEGERNNEIQCNFGPGFLESRGKPGQPFSSTICTEARVEIRQCQNGTMLGT